MLPSVALPSTYTDSDAAHFHRDCWTLSIFPRFLPLNSLLKTLSFAKNWCLFAIHRRHRSVEAPLTHIILSKCIWTMTTLFFIFMFMMSGMRRLVFSMSAVGSVDFVGSTHHRHCECRFTTLGVEGGRKEWVRWTWSLWFVRWSDW